MHEINVYCIDMKSNFGIYKNTTATQNNFFPVPIGGSLLRLLKVQSHQILNSILVFRKLNQYFL